MKKDLKALKKGLGYLNVALAHAKMFWEQDKLDELKAIIILFRKDISKAKKELSKVN